MVQQKYQANEKNCISNGVSYFSFCGEHVCTIA